MYQLRDYQQYAIDACVNFIKYRAGVNGFGVSPGGSGKSVMIGKLAEEAIRLGKRVVILARSEKLLRQNREKINHDSVGIYCASIGERDYDKDITIASIQSIANLKETLTQQLIIVDECHEIHPDSESETQYWNFIRACGNPQVIGFTATDFRTGSGKISWGEEIFRVPLKPLIEQGYLCPPTNKVPVTPDLANVDVRLGDYVESQLEDVFLSPDLLRASIKALLEYGADRNYGLVFCQSRKHAAVVNQALIENGQQSFYVDGDTPKDKLDEIIQSKPKFICNNNLMTTGYDLPWIDMVAVLRSTLSKGLFEQMLYRGTRLYEGKKDFLVLDMGGNLLEHGALGSPYTAKSTRERQKPQGRICPQCETYTPSVRDKQCPDCGYEFPPPQAHEIDHNTKPDVYSNVVHDDKPYDMPVDVVRVYTKKSKKTQADMVIVEYVNQYGTTREYLQPHHANEWVASQYWNLLSEAEGYKVAPMQLPIDQLVIFMEAALQKNTPVSITLKPDPKFPKVLRRVYKAKPLEDEIPW